MNKNDLFKIIFLILTVFNQLSVASAAWEPIQLLGPGSYSEISQIFELEPLSTTKLLQQLLYENGGINNVAISEFLLDRLFQTKYPESISNSYQTKTNTLRLGLKAIQDDLGKPDWALLEQKGYPIMELDQKGAINFAGPHSHIELSHKFNGKNLNAAVILLLQILHEHSGINNVAIIEFWLYQILGLRYENLIINSQSDKSELLDQSLRSELAISAKVHL